MNTPFFALLNVHTSAWLQAEKATWSIKVVAATGQDKIDAQNYLNAVIAELAQRAANNSQLKSILTAPADLMGINPIATSAGAGSIVGGTIDAVGATIANAGSTLKNIAIYGGAAVVLLGAVYLWSTKK